MLSPLFEKRRARRYRAKAGAVAPPTPPPPPPPPAVVVAGSASGFSCSLRFDRPIAMIEGAGVDGSILFDGIAPLAVGIEGDDVLAFTTASELFGGSTWQVVSQPGYLATEVVVPESGVFEGPPPPPPGPPTVVSTAFSGTTVNLTFDQPVVVNGNPPDDSITINGVAPVSGGSADAYTLWLGMPDSVNSGDAWAISAQPGWVDTEIAVPESGVL